MGTAYAVWTGIGAVGTVLVGIFLFIEPATFWRLFFLFTLIHQLLGLNLSRRIKRKPILIVSTQMENG
ncbi:DMT family transporter [Flavobacterium aquiphilum]|uniref:DMT family transporter n=1 Tax=Flavobacterium aquiphilum TaxID=3003261 RepID=UPI003D7C0CAF